MSQTIGNTPPYSSTYFFAQAIPGLIADSTDVKNVDTFAANTAIGFGLIVSRTAAAALTVTPGGTANFVGISLHDHLIASRGGYNQYDAVSVMSRGRAWCLVTGATTGLTDGAPVYVTPTGGVSAIATGNTLLIHAVFRSAPAAIFDVLGGASVNVAVVELHYPFAA